MNNLFEEAEKAVKSGNLEIGIEIANQILEKNLFDNEALMLKATIYYKQQKWGDALNVLNKILEFNPENNIARNYKQMVINILAFWNKDGYNP